MDTSGRSVAPILHWYCSRPSWSPCCDLQAWGRCGCHNCLRDVFVDLCYRAHLNVMVEKATVSQETRTAGMLTMGWDGVTSPCMSHMNRLVPEINFCQDMILSRLASNLDKSCVLLWQVLTKRSCKILRDTSIYNDIEINCNKGKWTCYRLFGLRV